MKNDNELGLDFWVDKLTNSIENVVTGDSFTTEVSLLSKAELKLVSKKVIGCSIGNRNTRILKRIFIS